MNTYTPKQMRGIVRAAAVTELLSLRGELEAWVEHYPEDVFPVGDRAGAGVRWALQRVIAKLTERAEGTET